MIPSTWISGLLIYLIFNEPSIFGDICLLQLNVDPKANELRILIWQNETLATEVQKNDKANTLFV